MRRSFLAGLMALSPAIAACGSDVVIADGGADGVDGIPPFDAGIDQTVDESNAQSVDAVGSGFGTRGGVGHFRRGPRL